MEKRKLVVLAVLVFAVLMALVTSYRFIQPPQQRVESGILSKDEVVQMVTEQPSYLFLDVVPGTVKILSAELMNLGKAIENANIYIPGFNHPPRTENVWAEISPLSYPPLTENVWMVTYECYGTIEQNVIIQGSENIFQTGWIIVQKILDAHTGQGVECFTSFDHSFKTFES